MRCCNTEKFWTVLDMDARPHDFQGRSVFPIIIGGFSLTKVLLVLVSSRFDFFLTGLAAAVSLPFFH